MNQTLAFGPLAFPVTLLLLLAGAAAGWFAGARVAARRSIDFDPLAYAVLGCALLAARLAFVLQYREPYLDEPLSILNIRDGGWSPLAAVAAGALCAVALASWRTRYALPLAVALAAGGGVWLAGAAAATLLQPAPASLPTLALTDGSGRPASLEPFRGKPLVLNLWASWCPPCRREMPVLQQAQQRRPDVEFVFVNQGEAAATVAAYLSGHGLALRNVLLDPGRTAARQLGQRALPSTLFFDRQGRLVATHVGELSHASLLNRLEAVAPAQPLPR